jgi:putative DNA primase/helicase
MLNRNSDTINQFLAAMARRELQLSDGCELVADGEWQRCDATNKINGKKSGSYKLCLDGPLPWGLYRNWTDGKDVDYWRGELNHTLTDAERAELERRLEASRIEHEARAAEKAEKATKRAREIWAAAQPASASHPYLKRKGIEPHGVRVSEHGLLIVPVYAGDVEPINLQYIDDYGNKSFLRFGRVKGCFFRIEGDYSQVIEAEGFATGALINEATGYCVAVAFNCGNLGVVARMIRAELSGLEKSIWKVQDQANKALGLQSERRKTSIHTKLIIAGDDDWKTEGNPGLMAALEAARTARALVALPHFGKGRKDGETDFNDLARVHGKDAVQDDIANAVEPNILLERVLRRRPHFAHSAAMVHELVALKQNDRPFYEVLLGKLKSKKLRITQLDRQVNAAIKLAEVSASEQDDEGDAILFPHWAVEPWDQPVDTAALLDAIEAKITRYVATLGKRAIVPALWTMLTPVHEAAATHSPILDITSPEANSGKSTLLGVINFLVWRPILSVDITGAVLFRSITKWLPTFLIDEADKAFVKNDDLRQVVNAGWTRGQGVLRCHPETYEPFLHPAFAPKALSMKGKNLPDTTLSRCIFIELKRKQTDEKVEDFHHVDDAEFAELRRKLARWAADNADTLRAATPATPPGFDNRRRMNWYLLFAIAELAGKKDDAWSAANEIERSGTLDDASIGTRLLVDIKEIFDAASESEQETGLLSRVLVERLTEDSEKPWAEYRNDKPLTQRQLAALLSPFGIRTEEVHPNNDKKQHGKGYKWPWFKEPWKRYLPPKIPSPPQKHLSDPRERANPSGRSVTEQNRSAQKARAARIENEGLPYGRNGLRVRADRNSDSGPSQKKTLEYRPNEQARLEYARRAVKSLERERARRKRAKPSR